MVFLMGGGVSQEEEVMAPMAEVVTEEMERGITEDTGPGAISEYFFSAWTLTPGAGGCFIVVIVLMVEGAEE